MFPGKKTYGVAIAMLIYAGSGWAAGLLEPMAAVQTILQALALMGLRIGISSNGKGV